MRLELLGTGGYHPNEHRHTACYALPECGLVLDAGTGMFRLGPHIQTDSIDLFLTHAHLDHIVGLTFLFDILNGRPETSFRVHAEPAKLEAIQRHLLAGPLFPAPLPIEWRPLADGAIPLPNGGRLTHFPLTHPGGSIGLRLDWPDRSVAYVTDTSCGPDATHVDEIRGVDLLLHECYFPDGQEEFALRTGHTCLSQAACVAAKAGAGRLLLIHPSPLADAAEPFPLDAARSIFADTAWARDQQTIEF